VHAQQVPGGSRRCFLARLQRRAVCTVSLAAVALALAPGASSASFHPLGSALNLNPDRGAFGTSIATLSGVPYVARVEINSSSQGEVRVARFDGSGWVEVGGALNLDLTQNVLTPSIAAVNGVPYVAWTEGGSTPGQELLHVKRFNGTTWVQVGSALNIDTSRPASAPRIASIGENAFNPGVPFVTWSESNGTARQIVVKRYDGMTWAAVGDALNVNASLNGNTPDIASIGGTILSGGTAYVTWRESSASGEQIRVKRLSGTSWASVGSDPLNVDPTKQASHPAIANVGGFVGGIPYVTWTEWNGTANQVRLANFSGSAWSPVGGSLNADVTHDASAGGIANVGGQPYVAFTEYIGSVVGQLHVKRVGASGFVAVGGVLNADPARSAAAPSIANVGGAADVSWEEPDAGAITRARVAREVAPVCNDTSVSVAHNTPATVPLSCNEGTREIVAAPAHGTLSGIDQAAGTVTYTPTSGYSGADSFSFRSGDGTLDSSAATAGLDVAAAVPPPPVAGVAATLTELTLAPAKFRAAHSGASMAAKRKRASIGTRVGYTLDRGATTTFAVTRLLPGIRKGKRCVAPPRRKASGAKPKRCTRTRTVGSFTRVSTAGVNHFRFTGRVAGKALPRGNYRLGVTAQVAGANVSNALTKRFSIVR
jgi:hypothetical protein